MTPELYTEAELWQTVSEAYGRCADFVRDAQHSEHDVWLEAQFRVMAAEAIKLGGA